MRVFEEWKYIFIVYVVMQMWLHLWHIVNRFLWVSPNVVLVAYAIVKNPQDELSNCCITIAYEYNKRFTFMMLVSNWMVSFDNFFVVNLFESYIV